MGVVEIVDVRRHGVQRRRMEHVQALVAKVGLARPNGPAATGDQACGASSTPDSLLPSTLCRDTVMALGLASILPMPKNWGDSVGGRFCFMSIGVLTWRTSGPNVRSILPGPKKPACRGPPTNSQNGSKSVKRAFCGV